MVAIPIVGGVRRCCEQNRRDEVRWGRLAMFGGVTILIVAALLCIPLPHRVTAPMVLEPADAARIYVDVPGTLVESVKAGDVVAAGQTLARLENHDMDLEIAELQGELDAQSLHLQNLERQQGSDPVAAAGILTAQKAKADLAQRLKRRLEDRQRLTLIAPRAGTVLPPRGQSAEPSAGRLPSWSDTPLEPRNLGAYLQTGTPFCLIGNPNELEGVAVIDQADVDFVRPGARASIKLDELPNQTLDGTVAAVAQIDLQIAPRELADRGDLPSRVDASGAVHPLETAYRSPHCVGRALQSPSAAAR